MSNRRSLPGAKAGRQPCALCGRGIRPGRGAVALPDGRSVHSACADGGTLTRRLSCGHVGMPGMRVVNEGGRIVCSRCASPEAAGYMTRKG